MLDYLAYGSKKKHFPIIIMFNSGGVLCHSERFLSDSKNFLVSDFKYLPNKIIHKYASFFRTKDYFI